MSCQPSVGFESLRFCQGGRSKRRIHFLLNHNKKFENNSWFIIRVWHPGGIPAWDSRSDCSGFPNPWSPMRYLVEHKITIVSINVILRRCCCIDHRTECSENRSVRASGQFAAFLGNPCTVQSQFQGPRHEIGDLKTELNKFRHFYLKLRNCAGHFAVYVSCSECARPSGTHVDILLGTIHGHTTMLKIPNLLNITEKFFGYEMPGWYPTCAST